MSLTEARPGAALKRPYSKIRNKPERSVTEIVALKAIPGLQYSAANETALFAVYNDSWRTEEQGAAYEMLRKHFRGVWNSRAATGTACHMVMESWFTGTTVDLDAIVSQLAEHDYTAKSWQGHEDEAAERLHPYVDGLEKWWEDFAPGGGTSEECVRTPGVYIGQRDRWYVEMVGAKWGLDLKTTAQQDDDKGVYLDSWALQLAAYDRAEEIVEYALDDKGKVIETGTRPNPPAERHGIVHLRGDSEYTLYEITQLDEAYEAFMSLAALGKWLNALKAKEARKVTP